MITEDSSSVKDIAAITRITISRIVKIDHTTNFLSSFVGQNCSELAFAPEYVNFAVKYPALHLILCPFSFLILLKH